MRDDREFWIQVRRGLMLVVAAIENRWNLPRGGGFTLGAAPPPEAPPQSEPPPSAPAQLQKEMSRDAVQQR